MTAAVAVQTDPTPSPSWEKRHANLRAFISINQLAVSKGKPLLKPNLQPAFYWTVKLERDQFMASLLAAVGRASKKDLICAGTKVKFVGEDGIDDGGLTRELWTQFRRQLFSQQPAAPPVFTVGARVQALYPDPREAAWYDATVASVTKRGGLEVVTVDWDDEDTLHRERAPREVRLLEPGAAAAPPPALFSEVFDGASGSAFVPNATADLTAMERVGKLMLKVMVESHFLPRTLACYVMAYICADDAHPLADRAAIGTSGAPTPEEAEAEADAVLRVVEALDADRARSGRRMITTPLAEQTSFSPCTADDVLPCEEHETPDETVLEDTPQSKAAAVCRHYHRVLIERRRSSLEALKRGFVCECQLPAPAAISLD